MFESMQLSGVTAAARPLHMLLLDVNTPLERILTEKFQVTAVYSDTDPPSARRA